MRFRTLELQRYGGFADRVIDFGDGAVDLHLVVGPNEAGKSTMLEAIGDLLFGIHGQSRQNWRYGYGDLRIRAVLERDGAVLDVTRRKGNSKTLLGADGSALPDDALASFLAGIDRATFERMFGLDHSQLRKGGDEILKGKDDTARIVLEAGTGIAGIGAQLTSLTDAAGALFKPGGQIPEVNRLLRERADALAAVRAATLTDADWTAQTAARVDAEQRLAGNRKERASLALQDRAIAQVMRTRKPLARLDAIQARLAGLTPLPGLPDDADARLAASSSERVAAREQARTHQATLDRVTPAIAAIALPTALLLHRVVIEDLDERRPVIETARFDLTKRRAELEAIDERLDRARADAGLAAGAPLPSPGWRARARSHVENVRTLAATVTRLKGEGHALDQADASVAEQLAKLPGVAGLEALRTVLADKRIDAGTRLGEADAAVATGERLVTAALTALAPWHGAADILATTGFPTQAAAEAHGGAIDSARAGLAAARQAAQIAETNGIRARGRINTLAASGPVPSAEAIAAARVVRDAARDDVLNRLAMGRCPDDLHAGAALVASIGNADLLADQRHADAERVTQHAAAIAARDEADALYAAATKLAEAAAVDLAAAEALWTALTVSVGFTEPLPPAGWAAWLAERTRALAAIEHHAQSAQNRDTLAAQATAARVLLTRALADAGEVVAPDLLFGDLLQTATDMRSRLDAAAHKRDLLDARAQSNREARAKYAADLIATAQAGAGLDTARIALLTEAGVDANASEQAFGDAAMAFETAADDVVAQRNVARQVSGLERDITAFDADTLALFRVLDRADPVDATLAVRTVAAELAKTTSDEGKLDALQLEAQRATAGVDDAARREADVTATVVELMRHAGVEEEAALAPALAANAEAARLHRDEAAIVAELADLSDGKSIDNLRVTAAALSIDDEVLESARIGARNEELQAEYEALVQTLTEARLAAERASTATAAAEAQQLAADATSGIAAGAERHIELAASAALLRWLIDRHRQTTQGPLIARAGNIFATVTEGAFTTLALDYGDGDRPHIVGVRTDASRVGVEGLSEGTRDQLYLALRLASIEGRAGTGTLPLICDDLLITADDGRSGAMLKVLAAASKTTQVILFTHHEHLIEVARRSIRAGAFKLHMIDRERAAAV